jgi:hypothetical protein
VLEIGVEQFIRVHLKGVTGQIKDFDLRRVVAKPSLDQLRVMHSQVVEDEEYLVVALANEPSKEADQDLYVECAGEHFPPHLAFVGDGQNNAQTFAAAVDAERRRLALGRVAASAHVVGPERCLVAPVNLRTRCFRTFCDGRIGLLKPLANRCRRLLLGLL